MIVIVVKNIADGLVEHREETCQSSQLGVVHHMFQRLAVLQALGYHRVGSKVRLQDGCALALNLLIKPAHTE